MYYPWKADLGGCCGITRTYYPVLLLHNPNGKPIADIWQDNELWYCMLSRVSYEAGPFGTRYDAELEAIDAWERACYSGMV